jgi:hypothetical protein
LLCAARWLTAESSVRSTKPIFLGTCPWAARCLVHMQCEGARASEPDWTQKYLVWCTHHTLSARPLQYGFRYPTVRQPKRPEAEARKDVKCSWRLCFEPDAETPLLALTHERFSSLWSLHCEIW